MAIFCLKSELIVACSDFFFSFFLFLFQYRTAESSSDGAACPNGLPWLREEDQEGTPQPRR